MGALTPPPRTRRTAAAATDAQASAALWAGAPPPDAPYLLLHDLWAPATLRHYEDMLERLRNSGVEAGLRNAPNAAAVSELTTQRAQVEAVVALLRSRLDDERFDVATVDASGVETVALLLAFEERRLAQMLQLKRCGAALSITIPIGMPSSVSVVCCVALCCIALCCMCLV